MTSRTSNNKELLGPPGPLGPATLGGPSGLGIFLLLLPRESRRSRARAKGFRV
jgi:hypothetical protein